MLLLSGIQDNIHRWAGDWTIGVEPGIFALRTNGINAVPWLTSYFDRGGGLACRKALYRLGSQRIIIPFRENPGPFHMLNTSPRPFREVVYNKPIRRFIQLRSAPTGPSALPVPAISEMLDGPLSPLVGNR